MELETIHIQNYRGLHDIELPLSQFVCITGQNNAGKSSVLQCLSHFLTGPVLRETDYYDPNNEITIVVTFSNVSESDLGLLAEEHRGRIAPLVDQTGNLTLVRRYGLDRRSAFGYMGWAPSDPRFSPENVAKLVEKKQAKQLKVDMVAEFPELADQAGEATSQKAVKFLIQKYGDTLPQEDKVFKYCELPTGIDDSILPMLPEAIYIPAVKDLSDETKTAQTSSFGKILAIVTRAIEPALAEENELFERLSRKLNRTFDADGVELDGRLQELIQIERAIQDYVRQSFANVHLEIEIPPPELKSVLSTARIFADDGVRGPVELKGDGLRRAVVFSILRAYVDLNRQTAIKSSDANTLHERGYLLLFEEPELFLHPDAQKILFDALEVFSKKHHVAVTTHSPLFLGPGPSATFIKLSKFPQPGVAKPYATACHAKMDGIDLRDAFQLIGFESNNAAFFSRSIVLVEGDCDYIVFPHIASTFRSEWNCRACSISFVRVGGKGNFKRYKDFFRRFGVPVYVIADLDALDHDSFKHLEPSDNARRLHKDLMEKVTAALVVNGEVSSFNSDDVRRVQSSYGHRALWEKVRAAKAAYDADNTKFPALDESVTEFFAWEKKSLRRECIRMASHPDVANAKRKLIWELRSQNTFILELGEIEQYYPSHFTGEKIEKALTFKGECTSVEWLSTRSPKQICPVTGREASEFEFICTSIFPAVHTVTL